VRGPRLRRRRDGARARLCQKWSAAGGRGPVAEEPATPSRGVKDAVSELTEFLARRLWGVASFFAFHLRRRMGRSTRPRSTKGSPFPVSVSVFIRYNIFTRPDTLLEFPLFISERYA
jgi:hypothetical protein